MKTETNPATVEGNALQLTITNLQDVIDRSNLAPHTILSAVSDHCRKMQKEAKETRLTWPDCLLSGIWKGYADKIEELANDIQHGRTPLE